MLASALLHGLHLALGAALGEQSVECGVRSPLKLLCLQASERAFLTRAFKTVKDLELRRIAAVKDVTAAFAEAYKCAPAFALCPVLIFWKRHPP